MLPWPMAVCGGSVWSAIAKVYKIDKAYCKFRQNAKITD